MDKKEPELGDVVLAINEVAEGAMSGLVSLLFVLRRSDTITNDEARTVVDAITRAIPEDRMSNLEQAWPLLVPGYQRRPNPTD